MGHQAVQKATEWFLSDRPCEELGVGGKDVTTQTNDRAGSKEKGEDEDEDEQTEPSMRTEAINLEDIPGGEAIVEEDEDTDDDDDDEKEESDSDNELEEDLDVEEMDAGAEASRYAEF